MALTAPAPMPVRSLPPRSKQAARRCCGHSTRVGAHPASASHRSGWELRRTCNAMRTCHMEPGASMQGQADRSIGLHASIHAHILYTLQQAPAQCPHTRAPGRMRSLRASLWALNKLLLSTACRRAIATYSRQPSVTESVQGGIDHQLGRHRPSSWPDLLPTLACARPRWYISQRPRPRSFADAGLLRGGGLQRALVDQPLAGHGRHRHGGMITC